MRILSSKMGSLSLAPALLFIIILHLYIIVIVKILQGEIEQNTAVKSTFTKHIQATNHF
jgi:uncharacterized protein (UPF0333 family)